MPTPNPNFSITDALALRESMAALLDEFDRRLGLVAKGQTRATPADVAEVSRRESVKARILAALTESGKLIPRFPTARDYLLNQSMPLNILQTVVARVKKPELMAALADLKAEGRADFVENYRPEGKLGRAATMVWLARAPAVAASADDDWPERIPANMPA